LPGLCRMDMTTGIRLPVEICTTFWTWHRAGSFLFCAICGGAVGAGPGWAGRVDAVELYEKSYKMRRGRRKVAGVVRKIVQNVPGEAESCWSCTKNRTKCAGGGGKSLELYEKSYKNTGLAAGCCRVVRKIVQNAPGEAESRWCCTKNRTTPQTAVQTAAQRTNDRSGTGSEGGSGSHLLICRSFPIVSHISSREGHGSLCL